MELRVFEGEGETKTDITFSHNANFFLFTTLENARPMAKGRVPGVAPTFPVLTGSPVAGMAYLDRPTPAGYFIFPDLSVRHEGMYRLGLSLFEELKETKDADIEPPEGSPKAKDVLLSSSPMAPRAHVHFRLEVKSIPFPVYSAKKFPGLAESTLLSRTVAEQGCRVRIRRDVRMRRRDKASDGYPDYEDENAYSHPDHYGTPQQIPDRPRSISNGSMDAQTPYSAGRRPSLQDMGYFPPPSYPAANSQQPPSQAPTHSAGSYGSNHLSFGGSSTPQYATPTFPLPQALHQQQQPYVQDNNAVPFPPTVHTRQMSVPQNFGYHQSQSQSQQPAYTQPQLYNDGSDYRSVPDSRRASAGINMTNQQPYAPQMMHMQNQHQPALQSYYHPTSQPTSRTTTPINPNGQGLPQLPPLRNGSHIAVEPKYEPTSPASRMAQVTVPPYSTSIPQFSPTTPQTTDTTIGRSQKRAYDNVFSSPHLQQSMHSGMRPSTADQGRDIEQIETDTGELQDLYNGIDDLRERTLIYKRADGSQQAKKCPSPIDHPKYVLLQSC